MEQIYYLVDRSIESHPLGRHICHAHKATIRIRSNYVDTADRWIQEHIRICNETNRHTEKLDTELNKFVFYEGHSFGWLAGWLNGGSAEHISHAVGVGGFFLHYKMVAKQETENNGQLLISFIGTKTE